MTTAGFFLFFAVAFTLGAAWAERRARAALDRVLAFRVRVGSPSGLLLDATVRQLIARSQIEPPP